MNTLLYNPRWRNAVKGVRYSYDSLLGGGNILAWGLGSNGNYDKSLGKPLFWHNATAEEIRAIYTDAVIFAHFSQSEIDDYAWQNGYDLQDAGQYQMVMYKLGQEMAAEQAAREQESRDIEAARIAYYAEAAALAAANKASAATLQAQQDALAAQAAATLAQITADARAVDAQKAAELGIQAAAQAAAILAAEAAATLAAEQAAAAEAATYIAEQKAKAEAERLVAEQGAAAILIAQRDTAELAAATALWEAQEAERVAAAAAVIAEQAQAWQIEYLASQQAIDDAARAAAKLAQEQAAAAVLAEQTRIAQAAKDEEEKLRAIADKAQLDAIEAARIATATAENGTQAAADLAAKTAADMAVKATEAQAERDAAYEVAKTTYAQIGTGITNAGTPDIYIDPKLTPPLATSLPYSTQPLAKTSVTESGITPAYIIGGIAVAGILALIFKK
jgi:hypothetical protein